LTLPGKLVRIYPYPPMKISFITPSPSTLKQEWYRDLHYQKVGVPNLAGWLRRAGYPDIRHYDFNNQVTRAYAARPGSVNLMLYADADAVRRYLRSGGGALEAQTGELLDLLKVRDSRLFGLSLTYFLGDELEIKLGVRLAQCLARVLKERFPSCSVLLGGLQNMDTAVQQAEYEQLLKECPQIDYAVCGDAHRAALLVCRALEAGREPAAAGPIRARKINKSLLLYETEPGEKAPAPNRYFEPLPDGELRDPSVPPGYPAYDPVNSRGYAYTPSKIREIYRLPAESVKLLKGPGEKEKYLLLQVSFNEGCPFKCYFCSGAGTEVFSLSSAEAVGVLRRLKEEHGCRHFLFYNPNFNPTAAYAKNLLREIIKAKLDILWADCFNLRNIDAEMIDLMCAAGAVKVVAGLEYPTRRMLKYINKGLSLEQANRSLEALHKAGIWNHVLLITGLPTETWDDVRELEAWLKKTDPYVDAYTVGSFHMVHNSTFHKNPEKFGFGLGKALRLYSQSEFDEKGGLPWEQKHDQNIRSNRHVVEFINRMKGTPKLTGTRMEDSHLLMYLYRSLGRGRKDLVRALYRAAASENPHIAAAHAGLLARLKDPGSPLNALLRRAGATLDSVSRTPEELEFTLRRGGAAARCSLRARSEDILLNPAWNRLHGRHFVLHYDPAGPALLEDPALAALARKTGATLALGQPAACAPGSTSFTLRLGGSSAVFSADLNQSPPSVSAAPAGGPVLTAAVSDGVARLAASAALAAQKRNRDGAGALAALLPGVLAAVEDWDRAGSRSCAG